MTRSRILIACVGNIFLGDDAFGVEVARLLERSPLPQGVRCQDFGIRGIDLTYALLDPYEAVILVDASPRGGRPGTLYLVELSAEATSESEVPNPFLEAHHLDLGKVIRLASELGGPRGRLLLVGCEPTPSLADHDEFTPGLSEPVRASVQDAVPLILSLASRLLQGQAIEANARASEINPGQEVETWLV